MKIVAEWVEDEETAALLAEFGVDMIQGNLIGAATRSGRGARAAGPRVREAG